MHHASGHHQTTLKPMDGVQVVLPQNHRGEGWVSTMLLAGDFVRSVDFSLLHSEYFGHELDEEFALLGAFVFLVSINDDHIAEVKVQEVMFDILLDDEDIIQNVFLGGFHGVHN
jgi:hypothetical protein